MRWKNSRRTAVATAALAWMTAGAAAAAEAENMIGMQTQNEGFFAVPAKTAPAIDGDLKEWDRSGEIESFSNRALRDHFRVNTSAMWDARNLYLAFVWTDATPLNSTVNPDHDPTRGWVADAEQLRFRAGNQVGWITLWSYRGEKNHMTIEYWKTPRGSGAAVSELFRGTGNPAHFANGVESAYRKISGGFVHELKLPWSVLFREPGKTVRSGEKIQLGMEFIWGAPNGRSVPVLHRYADNMAKGQTSREFFWEKVSAWGDLECAAQSSAAKRVYRPDGASDAGVLRVRSAIPDGAEYFSLALDDSTGKRVRNLAGSLPVSEYRIAPGTVEIPWDGLDDNGIPVAPGAYRVRGVSRGEIVPVYEMSYGNPGTPPWATSDGKGAWGSDHARVENIARSGENMVFACPMVEGGYGLWAVGPDGKKRWSWSDARGIVELAANRQWVFGIPFHPSRTPEQYLFRFNAATGEPAPFPGHALETPARVFCGTPAAAQVRGMAGADGALALAFDNGAVVLLDPATGKKLESFHAGLQPFKRVEKLRVNTHQFDQFDCPFAFNGTEFAFVRDGKFVRRNRKTGDETAFDIPAGTTPSALAFAADGGLLVADVGADSQVKKFDRAGRLTARYGATGGRPRQGAFNPAGMREMSSIAADAAENVWAVEYTDFPRRTSVWNPDGTRKRDYIGNTAYSAAGTFLHDSDPGRGFAGPLEFALDLKTRTWQPRAALWNPAPGTPGALRVPIDENTPGHIFRQPGTGREFYFAPGSYRRGFVILRNFGEAWRPVAGVFRAGRISGELDPHGRVLREPEGEFAGVRAHDGVFWADRNGDGLVQRTECEIVPSPRPGTARRDGIPGFPAVAGWGQRMNPETLEFYASDGTGTLWRYKPEIDRDGNPVYRPKNLEKVTSSAGSTVTDVVPKGKILYGFEAFDSNRRARVFGRDAATGRVRWTYPSPYHHVHGSHAATMPAPGLLIGPLKIAGVVPDCGEAGDVLMLRGNLGQDFYLTGDGFFVGSMFRDGRIPGPSYPKTEDELHGRPMSKYTQGSEPFNGWIGRHTDGVVRMSCGMFGQAATVMRIQGLETLKRVPESVFTLTPADAARAAAAVRRRADAGLRANVWTIPRFGGDWSRIPAERFDGVTARLAWDAEALRLKMEVSDDSPWKNRGTDFRKLFKTGDAIDLQLGTREKPTQCRVLFAGDFEAVLLRPVAPGAPKSENALYSSPVMTLRFDSVKRLDGVRPTVAIRRDGYTVTAAIPWKFLPFKPAPGLEIGGDAGVIRSDRDGMRNIARTYRFNRATGLVSDLPGEARMETKRWGRLILGK